MPKFVKALGRLEELSLTVILLGLALIAFVQVVSRYVFHYSFAWFEELSRYLGVLIAFLGAGLGVKLGVHFTMDLVLQQLKPPYNHLVRLFTNLISSLFFGLVVYLAFKLVFRMYGFGTTSPAMRLPMYLVYLPIPVFSLVMSWRFLAIAFREAVALGSSRDKPGPDRNRAD